MATVDLSTLPLDYINANQGPKLDAIAIFTFTLAVVAVFLRFLARILTKASLWWDDWFVLVALIFAVGPLALTLFLVENQFGKHAVVAGSPALLTFYKCLYAFEIVYPFPITLTKVSILLYYRRLFRVQSIKIPIYIVLTLVLCWPIYVEGAAIFTCTPIQKMWDPTVEGGHCIDVPKFFIGIAVPNIFTDLVLLLMPLPYIWGLQVKLPQKIAVIFVFILGGFVFIVSITRLAVLLNLDNTDATWSYVPTCIWTNIEVHIGIVTASVPAFWPLLRAIVTGSVRKVSNNPNYTGPTGMTHTPPNANPSFLSRSRRVWNVSTVHQDEQGFVYLRDIGSESPAPSQQDIYGRAPSEERSESGISLPAKPEKATRIQIKTDWTVSTENYDTIYDHKRDFLK